MLLKPYPNKAWIKSIYEKLFTENQFYTPDYALEELQIYQELILEKTKLAPDILQTKLNQIEPRV